MSNIIFNEQGEFRTWPLSLSFLILTIIGVFFLAPEIVYNWQNLTIGGFFQVVGPAAGSILFYKGYKKYQESQDGKNIWKFLLIGVLLFWGGLFGPNVGFKIDREASIPDIAIYYANGKIKNTIDSTSQDYYFKQISLNPIDSAYVVEYGEEPGYNKSNAGVRSGEYDSSIAPRANEDWERPITKEAEKFKIGKRN